jgi:glycosyltransferase involved in cell wall biosynthesis
MKEQNTPLVSIITATYNRSNVLKYAIKSVLASTFTNWEMIIVSDASIDDTAEVVRSFDDPRIRFFELEQNIGVQSGPNNEGLKHARGRYVAYLNHDDLWFPEHLELLVRRIEETQADWVFSMVMDIKDSETVEVYGIFPDSNYSPYYGYVQVSSWLVKKEVIDELGGWRMSWDILVAPSQDLLIRAYKKKKIIVMSPYATVILIHSGYRKDCYAKRESNENEYYYEKILNDPGLKAELLKKGIISLYTKRINESYKIRHSFNRFLVAITISLGKMVNINPVTLSAFLKYRRKGRFINELRKIRGLEPIKRKK